MLGFPLQQIEHEDVIERVSVISDGGGLGGGCVGWGRVLM